MSKRKGVSEQEVELARNLRSSGLTWREIEERIGLPNLCQAVRHRDRKMGRPGYTRFTKCEHCGHPNNIRSYFCSACRVITRVGKSVK